MSLKTSFLYALKMLFSSKRNKENKSNGQKTLTGAILCIGISVIPLVAVLSVSDGMIEGMTGRLIGLSTQDICVYVDSYSDSIADYESFNAISQRVKGINNVKDVLPEVQTVALAAGKVSRTGATVRAVPGDVFENNKSFKDYFNTIEGKIDLSRKNNAVIGQKIAETLNLHAGDTVRLIFLNTNNSKKIVPKYAPFTISAIISSGYQEMDALWIFIPLKENYNLVNNKTSIYSIGVNTDYTFSKNLQQIKHSIYDNLLGYGKNKEIISSSVYTWKEVNASNFENFSSTKTLLLLIMILIVLVASVNISSALVMIVMERRKEIAILKSIGSTPRGVTISFLIVGFVCGVSGLIIGLPLGLFVAVNINSLIKYTEIFINFFVKIAYFIGNGDLTDFKGIKLLDPAYYLQNIPVSIPLKELLIFSIGTIMLSLIASAIPAVKAGKEKPIDTLRKL